jgi:hypothetical protein
MLLKPNDLPPMIVGEARNVTFKLGGAVGANTIDDFAIEAKPGNLTFGNPAVSGSNVTVLVNADSLGEYTLVATAELSSGETVKGHVRVKVIDADCGGRSYH